MQCPFVYVNGQACKPAKPASAQSEGKTESEERNGTEGGCDCDCDCNCDCGWVARAGVVASAATLCLFDCARKRTVKATQDRGNGQCVMGFWAAL